MHADAGLHAHRDGAHRGLSTRQDAESVLDPAAPGWGGAGRVGGATWLCHRGPFPVSRLPNGGVLGGGSGSQTGEWWWSEGGGVAVSGQFDDVGPRTRRVGGRGRHPLIHERSSGLRLGTPISD